MTLGEIYKEGKNILKNANIDNYSFDVMCASLATVLT